jgi:hypothetical protein
VIALWVTTLWDDVACFVCVCVFLLVGALCSLLVQRNGPASGAWKHGSAGGGMQLCAVTHCFLFCVKRVSFVCFFPAMARPPSSPPSLLLLSLRARLPQAHKHTYSTHLPFPCPRHADPDSGRGPAGERPGRHAPLPSQCVAVVVMWVCGCWGGGAAHGAMHAGPYASIGQPPHGWACPEP